MLTMDEQNYLTALREIEGRSLRDIAAHTGYHFNPVKKYADREDRNMEYRPRKPRISGLAPLKVVIDEWIKEDLKRKRKHRRTATKIYNDIVSDKKLSALLIVGRQTVTNYVSKRKKELNITPYSTAMYTLHTMCEAQVDFGEVLVMGKNGAEEKWHILVKCLCVSQCITDIKQSFATPIAPTKRQRRKQSRISAPQLHVSAA